jgi:hypothetical protein
MTEIKITTKIERQCIEDVLVTALEGGSNYWYWLPDSEVLKIRKAVSKKDERCLSIALFKAVFDHGIDIEINDIENQDELLGVLSTHTIESRLQKLADGGEAWALTEWVNGEGDANSADILFQYMVLGEVIYG